MSFFSCKENTQIPGKICGNPLNGLCEKVCILTDRVFDSAIVQRENINETITLANLNPANPALPLTFVRGDSTSGEAIIQNLEITRITDRPNFARVQGEAVIPIRVQYTDANGVAGAGFSTVIVPFDVVLFVPQDALVPYEIQASGSAIFLIGSWSNDSTFNLTGCINLVLRVVCRVQILVPSYGYCLIPTATEYNNNVCRGFFDRPLYPSGLSNVNADNN